MIVRRCQVRVPTGFPSGPGESEVLVALQQLAAWPFVRSRLPGAHRATSTGECHCCAIWSASMAKGGMCFKTRSPKTWVLDDFGQSKKANLNINITLLFSGFGHVLTMFCPKSHRYGLVPSCDIMWLFLLPHKPFIPGQPKIMSIKVHQQRRYKFKFQRTPHQGHDQRDLPICPDPYFFF